MYAQKAGGRMSVGKQMRDMMLSALSERDEDLGEHNEDVARFSRATARKLGMTSEQIDEVVRAAELHDVGKVAVPDSILFKPGPLTDDEWLTMRLHPVVGERILSSAPAPALAPVGVLVRAHHERWDGGGYPHGLAGERIPVGARIVSVCDAYDAMVTDRPYRKSLGHEQAIIELKRCAGAQFDPAIVTVFLALMAEEREAIMAEEPAAQVLVGEPQSGCAEATRRSITAPICSACSRKEH
ncbi:MAG: HD-GYP domain-containing protein [Solirubrobacteraceae bacterium]